MQLLEDNNNMNDELAVCGGEKALKMAMVGGCLQ